MLYHGWIKGNDKGELSAITPKIEALRQQYNVKPKHVMLDSGYYAQQVYNECVKYGSTGTVIGQTGAPEEVFYSWLAAKGDDEELFTHHIGQTKVSRPYKPKQNMPTDRKDRPCPLYIWSNDWIKDQLQMFIEGKVGKFLIAEDDPEYVSMMNVERKLPAKNKSTGKPIIKNGKVLLRWQKTKDGNEAWDCEAMILVLAWIYGAIQLQ
jgi:hypothetical protein